MIDRLSTDISNENEVALKEEILHLKKEKNAIILAHYYQILAIQETADLVGDSLGLSKAARDVEKADTIVFAAVHFMAESAKILNPDIKVLIPNLNAGCPLANQCSAKIIGEARKFYGEGIPVVVYVNTTAETKAAADVTCTSSNAVSVVQNLKTKKVLFGPDRNLGLFVQKKLPKVEIIPIPEDSHCYVHKKFDLESIRIIKEKYPEAVLLAHPECNLEIQEVADFVGSTSALLQHAKESTAKVLIIATEKGLVDRLTKFYPEKKFILAKETAICKNMKKITLKNVLDALKYEQYEITIPNDIQEKAKKAINRMFELT